MPNKLRGKKGKRHGAGATQPADYTQAWKNAIQQSMSDEFGLQYLILLEETIRGLSVRVRRQPPRVPPPPPQAPRDTPYEEPFEAAEDRNNRFAGLYLEHLGDDSSSDEGSEAIDDNEGVRHGTFAAEQRDSMQLRYILIEIKCVQGDLIRREAIQQQKRKMEDKVVQYKSLILLWNRGFLHFNAIIQRVEPWNELYLQCMENGIETMPNHHNFQQLENMFYRLRMVTDDTHRDRDSAVVDLNKRLGVVIDNLAPMLKDRDQAKVKMGETKWTTNPNPAMTFAEKRRYLEEEKKALEEAISIISSLVIDY